MNPESDPWTMLKKMQNWYCAASFTKYPLPDIRLFFPFLCLLSFFRLLPLLSLLGLPCLLSSVSNIPLLHPVCHCKIPTSTMTYLHSLASSVSDISLLYPVCPCKIPTSRTAFPRKERPNSLLGKFPCTFRAMSMLMLSLRGWEETIDEEKEE